MDEALREALDAAMARADEKHGRSRDYRDLAGNDPRWYNHVLNDQRKRGQDVWEHILVQEVCEVNAAESDERRCEELLDVATAALAWRRAIQERK